MVFVPAENGDFAGLKIPRAHLLIVTAGNEALALGSEVEAVNADRVSAQYPLRLGLQGPQSKGLIPASAQQQPAVAAEGEARDRVGALMTPTSLNHIAPSSIQTTV